MSDLRSRPSSGVLLWDIDGTLIRTKRPNSSSPHKNVLRRRGHAFDETKLELSGFTDYEVFLELVNNGGSELIETHLRDIFHDLDDESKYLDKGSTFDLFPGVQSILEVLSLRGWAHGILTGNTSARMAAKLKLTGITDHFNEEFLFSCKFGDSRENITRNARESLNRKNHHRVLIIGDTPKDIVSARLSNFPVISVATGSFSVTDLSNFGPNLLLKNLEDDADILLKFLGTPS